MVDTFGFQSPHVDMSDQMLQTRSAAADVSNDVPYSVAIDHLFSLTWPRPGARGELLRRRGSSGSSASPRRPAAAPRPPLRSVAAGCPARPEPVARRSGIEPAG